MKSDKRTKTILVVIACFIAVLFLLPLVFMFFTSFKSLSEALSSSSLFPKAWTFENYVKLLGKTTDSPVVRWFLNTALISCIGSICVVTVDVLAAYALARLNMPSKNKILVALVWVMSIPGIITLFPSFYIFKSLSLMNNFIPLTLPYTANALGVYMIYNFLVSFPLDLEESALVDGASLFQILINIIMPSIKPVVLTLGFLTFLSIYNDYLWPNLIITSNEMKTVTVGIATLVLGANFANPGMMMAATFIAVLPALILFLFVNKYIVQGVNNSGIK